MSEETKPAENVLPDILQPAGLVTINQLREEINTSVNNAVLFGSKIVKITKDDDKTDEIANAFLVKCNKTMATIKEKRLSYTRKIDAFVSNEMMPEKKLQAEMDRIRALRDQRATEIDADVKARRAEVERQKNYELYVIDVKRSITQKVEMDIIMILKGLDDTLAEKIEAITEETHVNVTASMTSWKPALKPDKYISMFNVLYDKNKMTDEQFDEIRAKAMSHYTYDILNEKYTTQANEIKAKHIASIPGKLKEIAAIKAGNKAAEAEAARRKEEDLKRRADNVAKAKAEMERKTNEEAQSEELSAEFKSQVQHQDIEDQSGTRKKIVYRLEKDTERDLMKLAQVVTKCIVNMVGEKKFKGVFKLDKDGHIKLDAKGNREYVDGVQFWLTQLENLPFTAQISGITTEEVISTTARK